MPEDGARASRQTVDHLSHWLGEEVSRTLELLLGVEAGHLKDLLQELCSGLGHLFDAAEMEV